jgi:HK97 gp10 family phage protein
MANVDFTWNGDAVQAEVMNLLHRDMAGLGGFLVGHMQAHAPVDTGLLVSSMTDSYDPSTFTLTITIGAPYSVYVEFGTRNQNPHPYIRPTIIDAAAAYPWIDWDVLLQLNPPVVSSSHLRASASGFKIPKSAHLSPSQLKRVNEQLRPTSRTFAGKFKRRKIGFKVQGPDRRGF